MYSLNEKKKDSLFKAKLTGLALGMFIFILVKMNTKTGK